MSAEITYINGSISVAEGLREIADLIDAGEYEGDRATLLLEGKIIGLGMGDEEKTVEYAAWNLNCALHRIMAAANGIEL